VSEGLIKFDEFALDCDRYELLRAGRRIKLEKIPMELLILLVTKDGHLVTRQEIIEHLWGKDVFLDTEHGINTAVRKIRIALRDDPEKPRFVQTVTGMGYRFIVTTSANGNGSAPAIVAEPPAVSEPEAREPKPLPLSIRRRWLSIPAFSVAIVACVITMLWLLRPSLPLLKITSTVQLTSDGRTKFGYLATDGVRVYFSEIVEDSWTIAAVSISGGEPVRIHTPFQNSYLLNISPDRSRLLVLEGPPIEDHALWAIPVLGGPPRRLENVVGHSGSWSPDGQKMAYTHGSDVYLAKADGTDSHKLAGNTNQSVWAWSPTWSRKGDRLRFEWYHMGEHKSGLWEITTDGRNLHMVLPVSDDQAMQCCGRWTRDGKYYIFDLWNGVESGFPWPAPNIWGIREASSLLHKTSREPFQLTAGPIHFFDQILSDDGNAIYTTSALKRGELLRYDDKTGRLLPYLSGMSAEGVSFSADGAWMAYVKFPQGELWRSRTDGSEALQLTLRPLVTYGPTWSPDGKQIAFSGQKTGEDWQLYTVSVNGGTPQQLPQSTAGMNPTWSPDGRSLLFHVSHDGGNFKIRVLDVDKQQVSDFPGSQSLSTPRWSRDGRYIAAVSQPARRLTLFDFKTRKWTEWVSMDDLGWPAWSRDGNALYFINVGKDPGVFRVALKGHKPRKVTSLKDFRLAGAMGAWFSLTPNNEPLLLRDIGGTEIYALYWDALSLHVRITADIMRNPTSSCGTGAQGDRWETV